MRTHTHPAIMRAIGVSHTACKDEFRQNLRSNSWSKVGVYFYFYSNSAITGTTPHATNKRYYWHRCHVPPFLYQYWWRCLTYVPTAESIVLFTGTLSTTRFVSSFLFISFIIPRAFILSRSLPVVTQIWGDVAGPPPPSLPTTVRRAFIFVARSFQHFLPSLQVVRTRKKKPSLRYSNQPVHLYKYRDQYCCCCTHKSFRNENDNNNSSGYGGRRNTEY